MSTDDVQWQDYLAGHRMAVDREFADRVRQSDLSRQQWGLVMTAVEFDIQHAEDPDRAALVARTSKLEHVLPAMQEQGQRQPGGTPQSPGSSGGFLDRVKEAVGVGDRDGEGADALEREAERLTDAYAKLLQERLRREDQWEEIRLMATKVTEE